MQLLSGAWADLGYASASEGDYAAVRFLAFWTRDEDQIERLLRASGLVRTKYDQPGYLSRTLTRALALGGPVYSGKGENE
ncbi:hypothetical protein GCM10010840_08900 [Deinococcus aerolatus]|uniref:NrS-1 polymerase-like HBD domain-containing protein n=1 Tax=Deinococcus aerolatus TaxID=522487 RepID=A0ABQ2G3M9_9DEIO|nr:hypothetical protein [Deinococcus aerolatus]GGL73076.1 hypothetical protein GCM10010840_08900 [Deinococcus aerolatus]